MNVSSNNRKYQTKNVLRRLLIGNFLEHITVFVEQTGAKNILDAGCGEGFVILYLRKYLRKDLISKITIKGFDISQQSLKIAEKNIGKENVFTGDIYHIVADNDSHDLVLALEILEHLKKPEEALKELRRVANKYVLISVPLEPFFSYGNFIFGKNIKRFGKDKEHLNFWNRKEIVNLAKKYFIVEKVKISFPWTIILARKKSDKFQKTK